MGRPIKKKFFGNLNSGSGSTTGDNGIGGEGVDSISVATVGNFVVNNTYQNFPLLNIGAPNLPTGVQATADVVFEIDTVSFASGGQTDGDYLAGLSTSITGLGGGAVVRIVETANKVTSVDLVGGNRGEFRRGDFTGAGITTHQVLQAPNPGTDLQINVTYRLKSITMLEKGSGYTAVPTLSWSGHTFTAQTTPSGQTPTLTATQQNALKGVAYLLAKDGGVSAKTYDIVKQEASHRYLVRTADGIGQCRLIDSNSPGAGEMNLIATDENGSTYWVMKLTARRAIVRQRSMSGSYAFADNARAGWTLGSADTGIVSITNA